MFRFMKRIHARFESLARYDRTALIAYITAGDPHIDTTCEIMKACADAGCDLIEVGVPFSDPMADGPAVEKAMGRALEAGTKLTDVIEAVATFRLGDATTPVILFGYVNPFYQYGYARLGRDAKAAGVDGLLVVDLPPEEAGELLDLDEVRGLDFIGLFTPTSSDERVAKISKRTSGFAYYVSMTGVTGGAIAGLDAIKERVAAVRRISHLPVAVGFGIRTGEHARAVAEFADGVVIGSELIRRIDAVGQEAAAAAAGAFIREIRAALDAAPN
jgi:tryptophan synthase alpha chain